MKKSKNNKMGSKLQHLWTTRFLYLTCLTKGYMLIGFEVHEVSEANTAEENNEEREDK